jgi:hypothetical protein
LFHIACVGALELATLAVSTPNTRCAIAGTAQTQTIADTIAAARNLVDGTDWLGFIKGKNLIVSVFISSSCKIAAIQLIAANMHRASTT